MIILGGVPFYGLTSEEETRLEMVYLETIAKELASEGPCNLPRSYDEWLWTR